MKKFLGVAILIFGLMILAGCDLNVNWKTAKQIEAEGKKYAIEQQADQDNLNQEQYREYLSEKRKAEEAYKAERRQYWLEVWNSAKWIVTGSFYGIVVTLAISSAAFLWNFQKAASHFVLVRASLLPVQANGARPALILPKYKSLLQSLTYDKAFRITDTIYKFVDTQTGEFTDIDIRKPATAPGLEILRQAITLYVPTHAQQKTMKFSPDGHVARAIGESIIDIPSNPQTVIDLDAIKKALINYEESSEK